MGRTHTHILATKELTKNSTCDYTGTNHLCHIATLNVRCQQHIFILKLKYLFFFSLIEVLNAMLVLYSNDFAETLIPIIHASHQHWNKTSPPGLCLCEQ